MLSCFQVAIKIRDRIAACSPLQQVKADGPVANMAAGHIELNGVTA